MMKKFLVLLLSAMMVFSLVACGGDDTTGGDDQQVENNVDENNVDESNDDADVSGDYTAEQTACIEAWQDMLDDYNAAMDLANTVPEIQADTELVAEVNDLTAEIDNLTDLLADPANVTDDVIANVEDVVIPSVYTFVNRLNSLSELLPILTIAGVGADEEENTYWFACNEDVSFAAMIILSADATEYVYCVGDVVDNGDGTCTINDEEGYTMTMAVETVEDGLILTLQDGTEVGMVAAEPKLVVDTILGIEESVQNVNQ